MIETPIDALRWDDYQYILAHPVTRWTIPTSILYGEGTLCSPARSWKRSRFGSAAA